MTPARRPWQSAGRGLVVAVVVFLAVWTGSYHAALLVGVPAVPTLLVAGVLTALLGGWLWRGTTRSPQPADHGPDAAASGLWAAGWALGGLSAVLASVLIRPDADDAYLLNLSTFVREQGRFPLRDTIFTDQRLPALSVHEPPLESFEALLGAAARLLGLSAPTLAYVVVPPLFTLLAVLVLTWLVQSARPAHPRLALATGVLWWWMAAQTSATPGNWFALRMWQGKTLLAAVLLPLLVLLGTRLVTRGALRDRLLFPLALLAGLGLSNTLVLIAPVLFAGLGLGALGRPDRWRALLRLLPGVVVPLAAGLVMVLYPGRRTIPHLDAASPDLPTVPHILLSVPGAGGLLVSVLVAMAVGWWGVRSPALRATLVGLVVVVGVIVLLGWFPPVAERLRASALLMVAWRVWWCVPLALLVGTAASGLVAGRRRWVSAVVAAALGLLPLLGGQWAGDADNRARWGSPLDWKVPRGALERAELARSVTPPGGLVLLDTVTSQVLATLTVAVRPVAGRVFYLGDYEAYPQAQAAERRALQQLADTGAAAVGRDLSADLAALGVHHACLQRPGALAALTALGWVEAERSGAVVCLTG